MKDETLRYKNITNSNENSNDNNRFILEDKNKRIIEVEEDKNIIMKLYNHEDQLNQNMGLNQNNKSYIKDEGNYDCSQKLYNINNINLFQIIDDNNCFDINTDLLNKQKQLREIEKQIKKSVKKPKISNINNNKISKNNYNINSDLNNNNKKINFGNNNGSIDDKKNNNIAENININNNISNLENSNKNEYSHNYIEENNEEIMINPEMLNHNNSSFTQNKSNDNNLNKYKINNEKLINNNINNYIRYEKDYVEEDKSDIFGNYNYYEEQNMKNPKINNQNSYSNNNNRKDNKPNQKNKADLYSNNNNINVNINDHDHDNDNDESCDNNQYNENNNNISHNNKNEDMEMTYLMKLSNLKKENNNQIQENKQLKEEIENLNNELKNTKKELIDSKTLYDEMNLEYELLNKKYENLMNNQNKLIIEKENQMQNEIDELKSVIDQLNAEIKTKDEKSKNDINQLKQMLDSLKIIHEQLKDQYDLLILKMNTVNQENFSLKRELYFYQNNLNNSINFINKNNNKTKISNKTLGYSISSNSELPNFDNNNKKEEISKEENIDQNNNITKNKSINNNLNQSNDFEIRENNSNKAKNGKLNSEIKNYENSLKKSEEKDNKEIIRTITTSHRKFIANINQNDSSGVSALLKNNISDIQINNNNYKNKRLKTPIISLTKENNTTDKYSQFVNYKEKINNNNNIENSDISNLKNENTNNINNVNHNKSDALKFVNENTNSIYTKYSQGRKGRITRTKSVDKINNIFYQNDELNNNFNNKDDIDDFRPQKSQMNDKRIKEMEKTLNNLEKQRNIYLSAYNKLPENPKTQKELNEKRKLKRLIDEFNTNIYNIKSQEKNMKKGIKSN